MATKHSQTIETFFSLIVREMIHFTQSFFMSKLSGTIFARLHAIYQPSKTILWIFSTISSKAFHCPTRL